MFFYLSVCYLFWFHFVIFHTIYLKKSKIWRHSWWWMFKWRHKKLIAVKDWVPKIQISEVDNKPNKTYYNLHTPKTLYWVWIKSKVWTRELGFIHSLEYYTKSSFTKSSLRCTTISARLQPHSWLETQIMWKVIFFGVIWE